MKTLTVFALDRQGTPPGWEIYNAPRPLPGDRGWQGEFNHGCHYSSLDPQYPESERAILHDIEDLDGWRVIVATEQEFILWCDRVVGIDYAAMEPGYAKDQLRDIFLAGRFGVEE